MLLCLLGKMLYILVLCRVLLIAGVQTLTIDSQLGTSIEDCFERISIGEQLPTDGIYRNVTELTNRECEKICKQDKQCQAYDYGVGAKGNATCNLSTINEKSIKERNPLNRHPDYDVYVRRFLCEQSPPTPIKQPQYDEPESGPSHRPVFRPVDERPDDYLVSGDIGYGRPPVSPDRPDDISNSGPDDSPPSYGDHKPPEIPYRPTDLRPEKPNRPEAPYGQPQRPDPYRPSRPQNQQRPDPNDVLQFQGIGKPKPPNDYRPYPPEKPDYNYIIRPNRKPRPTEFDNLSNGYGHPSGPIGPPSRPYEKPTSSYQGQYAGNYGQNQNDNSIYVEINDPPRPYVPIKDRPNQQYYGEGYLGYGTYSSQNSYSQAHNSQYQGTITEIGFNQNVNRPYDRPERPISHEKPQKPAYGSPNDGYNRPELDRPNTPSYGQGSYGSNQGGYGSNQATYGTNISYNKGSYNGNKGSSGTHNYGNQGTYSQRPVDLSNYGETGYGIQKPSKPVESQSSYGGQNSYQSSFATSHHEQSSQNAYGSQSFESYRPNYENQGYGQSGYQKPSKPYGKPNPNEGGYGNHGSENTQNYGSSSQGNYQGNYASNGNYANAFGQGGYGIQSSHQNQGYGHTQGGHGNSQGYGTSSSHSHNSYGESHIAEHGSYGYQDFGNRPYQRPDYSNRPDYDDRRPGYQRPDYSQQKPGYGSQSTGYGTSSYGETKPSYSGTKPDYGQNAPSYGTKPSYGETKPGYGQNGNNGETKPSYVQAGPSYGQTKPSYGENRPSYGETQPSYGQTKPSYGETQPGYGQTKPTYGENRPSYGETQPSHGENRPSYGENNPSYGQTGPSYGENGPSYGETGSSYGETGPSYGATNQNSKPNNQSYRPNVKPVYEYELDKPTNVPSYIARPSGEVVTSRPVVIGDYERPVYKYPGKINYEACFRRVLAGQRALRSFVQRVMPSERLQDCTRECATEKRFHCESFNYRIDTSFRGKGLCELMTKPIESFDIFRDFVQDKDYDFYEIDRNSLEPDCPETIRGPGLLHSGYLASKDRIDRPGRPNAVEGWRDRNWRGDYDDRKGNRRYEDRFYVPYQIGSLARTNDDQENWGQYGGEYGSSYYKNRNDYHKSISHWGLTSERPSYGVKPYYFKNDGFTKDRHFDYHTLGKDLSFEKDNFEYYLPSKDERTSKFDYHFLGKDQKEFDYHVLGKDGKFLGADYYGLGGSNGYGHGSWKRWNTSGASHVFDFGDHATFFEDVERRDEPNTKDCFSHRRPGMSLSTGAIRRSLYTRNVLACETACFDEKEFKCVSYSYRYSNSHGSDNCFLSERQFHGLSLSADSGSDVYAMPLDQACSTISQTPWIESECFYHVRSDTAVTGAAARAALTVAGLGACEAECIRAQGFFCRGFSFRFDSPTIGEELHNCILTSSTPTSLPMPGHARGHELYARGNYGRGCEPALDHKEEGQCYLQYDKAAKLTPAATRGLARVESEQACSNICTDAPFKCLSFSYNNNALPDTDNCLLSEIRLSDLQKEVDYVHSESDWLFAYDLFNEKCWRKGHEEPSPEVPQPILHTSSEEDDSFLPLRPGARPSESFIPPSVHGFSEKTYYPPASSENYYPNDPSFRPNYPSDHGYKRPIENKDLESYRPLRPEIEYSRPEGPQFRPPEREIYKPFRPDYDNSQYKPGFKPPETFPGKEERPYPDKVGSGSFGYENPGSFGYEKPGSFGYEKPGSFEYEKPGSWDKRPQKPVYQGDREGSGDTWRHYTVSGFPCRANTACAQNVVAGHWACEPEGGEVGSWDYCCAPTHRCGYSEGFHKPWCYVGPKQEQWRPCSEKYYPYHQHNVPHPSQPHRDTKPRPWRDTPQSSYIPHWDKRPGPYLSEADKRYWDDLYENGPKAYYDKYGNPLPGYARVPTENRPRIRNRYRPGSGSRTGYDDTTGLPGGLGVPRYWPVAYLHRSPPPNMTYFRYNETKPTTTTEKNHNLNKQDDDRTTNPPTQSRELPSEPRNLEPDLDAKSSRDDKKINVSSTDNIINNKTEKKTSKNNEATTTEVIARKENTEVIARKENASEAEPMKTESYKDLDKIDGIDDKLDDFSKSIEVLNIEDVKGDKLSDLKTLEAEEKQIEAIGRLLASRRGTKIVLEKRSQKDLETKNIAVDKDLVDFNFGNRFPTAERKPERRGVIKRISKDEIQRDRNTDRSLEVSETTFVRPPRVLSTTENIRKAIVNGKVFYDATIREQRELFNNTTRPKILKREDTNIPFVNNNFREQRDFMNSTRKPKYMKRPNEPANITQENTLRRGKRLRFFEDPSISNNNNLAEVKDLQNITRNIKILRPKNDSIAKHERESNSSKIHKLEESSTPSVIGNSNFGKRKVLIPRNVNPVRRVRRVYRKRYNPEEVRKRLLERDRNKTSTESSRRL